MQWGSKYTVVPHVRWIDHDRPILQYEHCPRAPGHDVSSSRTARLQCPTINHTYVHRPQGTVAKGPRTQEPVIVPQSTGSHMAPARGFDPTVAFNQPSFEFAHIVERSGERERCVRVHCLLAVKILRAPPSLERLSRGRCRIIQRREVCLSRINLLLKNMDTERCTTHNALVSSGLVDTGCWNRSHIMKSPCGHSRIKDDPFHDRPTDGSRDERSLITRSCLQSLAFDSRIYSLPSWYMLENGTPCAI